MTTGILGREPFDTSRIDRAISLMAAPAGSGSEFFETAVEALSVGLGCKWAVIGELINDGKDVNVLAFWNDGALSKPFSYSLASGPCEVVYRTNRIDVHHFYPQQITKLFPEFELLKALGAEAYRGELFFDADGKPAGHVVALMDQPEADTQDVRALFRLITQRTGSEHKRMILEAALTKSESRYRNLIEVLPDSVIIHSQGAVIYANTSAARILGTDDPAKLIGCSVSEIIHPDDRAKFEDQTRRMVDNDEAFHHGAQRYQRFNGTWFEGEFSGARIEFDGASSVMTVFRDVTKQRQLEEQLVQTQKLEAIGKLTGGVAHDFNNLLAVIGGNAELLLDEVGSNPALTGPIVRAVKRGAELTQRLLAFSRRQPLRPQAIEVDGLVASMFDLLARTLGETIEFGTSASTDVWNAMADPGQVENALLNLAINARDAMPNGGKLTIECANTHLDEAALAENADAGAGDFVVLAVSDDGTGMSDEVKAHAFEPFFTTKEVGEGSGLGLSMVYGFAKQSGGHVSIYSEVGKGTTVKLYLPRAVVAGHAAAVSPGEDIIPRGQGEVILVIEDDPDVRALAVLMLESLGYQVIDVGDAAGADEVLAGAKPVDLVLSDVVLPGGTSGPQFAERARAIYPGIKIVFMSGYPAEAAMRNGFLGADDVLLNKPFERRQLAITLRTALL